jgi:diaminopimelate epimerase
MKIPMTAFGQTQAAKQDPLAFSKMSGAGNDFVVIDNRGGSVTDGAELAKRICTRGLSVGADGLILIERSSSASFRMRYYNSDGSLGEFCGNGTRCAARFAFLAGICAGNMTIETDAGIVSADVADSGSVTISLPTPKAFRADRPVTIGDKVVHGSSIVVGVPHYVIFLRDDLWSQEIAALGRAIRQHRELQPDGANVNFVVVRDRHSVELRTYERGVEAETMACGSGIVASVSVSALFGKVKSPVSILTRSGATLQVSYELHGDELRNIRLKGDARLIYRSVLTAETIEGFDPDFVRDPAAAESKVSSAD